LLARQNALLANLVEYDDGAGNSQPQLGSRFARSVRQFSSAQTGQPLI